jgi:hypothetical protein
LTSPVNAGLARAKVHRRHRLHRGLHLRHDVLLLVFGSFDVVLDDLGVRIGFRFFGLALRLGLAGLLLVAVSGRAFAGPRIILKVKKALSYNLGFISYIRATDKPIRENGKWKTAHFRSNV